MRTIFTPLIDIWRSLSHITRTIMSPVQWNISSSEVILICTRIVCCSAWKNFFIRLDEIKNSSRGLETKSRDASCGFSGYTVKLTTLTIIACIRCAACCSRCAVHKSNPFIRSVVQRPCKITHHIVRRNTQSLDTNL